MIKKPLGKRISCTVIFILITLAILFPHYSRPPVNKYDTWLHTERLFLFGNKGSDYSIDLLRTRAEIFYSIVVGFIVPSIISEMFSFFRRRIVK